MPYQPTKVNPTLMMSVGEHSGDLHGAYLVKALKEVIPNARLLGMGGPLMAKEGVDIQINLIPYGTVGISEAIAHTHPILAAIKKMKKLLETERPDALILIDYQGFNMMMVSHANKLGIPTLYYISPQEWIWGSRKNLRKVAKKISLMLAVFPQEAEKYQKEGGNITFIGHPFLDILPDLEKQVPTDPLPGTSPWKIGLFPGSRSQEVRSLFPTLLGAANILQTTLSPMPDFYVPVSAHFLIPEIKRLLDAASLPSIHLLEGVGQSTRVLKSAHLNLMVSGSITLEAALYEAPMIVGYRLSTLSYLIGKYCLGLSIPFISLPNIVMQQKVVPELVQNHFSQEKFARLAQHLLTNPNELATMKKNLKNVRARLGNPGVPARAAQIIKEFLAKS